MAVEVQWLCGFCHGLALKFQNGSCDGGIVSYTVQPFSGFTGVFAQSPYMQRRNTVKLSVS